MATPTDNNASASTAPTSEQEPVVSDTVPDLDKLLDTAIDNGDLTPATAQSLHALLTRGSRVHGEIIEKASDFKSHIKKIEEIEDKKSRARFQYLQDEDLRSKKRVNEDKETRKKRFNEDEETHKKRDIEDEETHKKRDIEDEETHKKRDIEDEETHKKRVKADDEALRKHKEELQPIDQELSRWAAYGRDCCDAITDQNFELADIDTQILRLLGASVAEGPEDSPSSKDA